MGGELSLWTWVGWFSYFGKFPSRNQWRSMGTDPKTILFFRRFFSGLKEGIAYL